MSVVSGRLLCIFSWLGVWLICPTGVCAQTVDLEITEGHSFTESKTGLLFPRSLAGLDLLVCSTYGDVGAGVSLRYQHPERSEWVDIYVYNHGLQQIDDKNEMAQSLGEIESAFDGVLAVEEAGQGYRKVEIEERIHVREVEVGELLVKVASQCAELEKRAPGDADLFVPYRTSISLTTFSNQFVKVRHTVPKSLGKKSCEEREAEVIQGFLKVIKEHAMRPMIEEAIADFSEDPMSEKGEEAAGLISSYAAASDIVMVTISPGVLPMLRVEGEDEEKLGPKFLAAYLAGCVREQLNNGAPDSYPGVLEQVKLYKRLRKGGEIKESIAGYEEWLKMERAGELKKYVTAMEGDE